MNIREHVSLSPYTTMKVGGNARYFCEVLTMDELRDAVMFAKERDLEVFVLGGGSNIVFDDRGFSGLVIKMAMQGVSYEQKGESVIVTADAGVDWDTLVADAVAREFCGFENLSLIPGTVGASVVQNIGAFGVEVRSFVESVDVFDCSSCSVREFTSDECAFGYRQSIFKTEKGKDLVVTRVRYRLSKDAPRELSYGTLDETLLEKGITRPSVSDVREIVCELRREKLPYDSLLGSAGSFFKNPVVKKQRFEELKKTYTDMLGFDTDDGCIKIPAGWIIDHVCSMKGVQDGSVGTYKKQALVIVNHGGATAGDIKTFAEKIRSCVKEKTGIELEREVEYVQDENSKS